MDFYLVKDFGKNASSKYSQRLFDETKMSATNAFNTASNIPKGRYLTPKKTSKNYRWIYINLGKIYNIIQKCNGISKNSKFIRQYNYSNIWI